MQIAPTRRPQRQARRLFASLAALATAAALGALPAAADPATGTATLSLAKAGKATSLAGQGVKVKLVGGEAGGLALRELTMGNPVVVTADGKLKFSLGKHRALVSDLRLEVKPRSTALSGKLGKRTLVVFRAQGDAEIGPDSLRLPKAALHLTGKGAKALRGKLGLEALSAGRIGRLGIDAKLGAKAPAEKHGQILAPKDEDIAPLPPAPYPYESQCPVDDVAGGAGFSKSPGEVSGIAAEPSFGATAQPVIGTSLDWGFKDSFRSYVLMVPPAGTLQPLDGASAHPAGPGMVVPGSFFSFPAFGGDYEAGGEPDHSDDKLVAEGTGTVLFCKSGHGFNVVLQNPTVTIDGEESRITADVGVNQNGTWYPFQRVDVAELDVSGIEPGVTESGNALTWEDVPATLTADGAMAMGIYEAGEPLDAITVRTKLDRPLLANCAIEAGTPAPTKPVSFGLAPLPALSNAATGTGGWINWGFRRAIRASVASPMPGGGSFQLLGGASEGYPGNMGGGDTPPPAGGQDKFFRFPVSRWAYEEGTPDPGDDRLIATSEATVGFCNPKAGNYGLVISKPTLVIDGANSRLVANAYSYKAGEGWIGGRVDVVDLDTAAVDAVNDDGTVRWGDVPADNNPLVSGIPVEGSFLTNAFAMPGLAAGMGEGGFDEVSAQIVTVD